MEEETGMIINEVGAIRYMLSPPAEEQEKSPVLCFLHGYDEGPPTKMRSGLTRHGPLRPGAPDIVRRFIVVAPQLPFRGDLWPLYAGEVAAMIEEVLSTSGGDPKRTYLTGFSFGGNGVFDLALKDATLWAALWPVDPTRVPPKDPGLPVWFSSGQVSRSQSSGFIERLRLMPPGKDPANDRIYMDDGLDHVGTATAAYGNRAIYEWLLSKSR